MTDPEGRPAPPLEAVDCVVPSLNWITPPAPRIRLPLTVWLPFTVWLALKMFVAFVTATFCGGCPGGPGGPTGPTSPCGPVSPFGPSAPVAPCCAIKLHADEF